MGDAEATVKSPVFTMAIAPVFVVTSLLMLIATPVKLIAPVDVVSNPLMVVVPDAVVVNGPAISILFWKVAAPALFSVKTVSGVVAPIVPLRIKLPVPAVTVMLWAPSSDPPSVIALAVPLLLSDPLAVKVMGAAKLIVPLLVVRSAP